MSAKLSQPTPWKYVPWHVEEDSDAVRDANNDLVCCVAGSDIANLIAEAGTVYHETGLTPRQLLDLANKHREQAQVYLEQRGELLEALKLHHAWATSERAGPDYEGLTRDTHPDGEARWRVWWNRQLYLCDRANDATDAAITRATTP